MGPIRARADQLVRDYAALDPVAAVFLGLSGPEGRLTDYGPDAIDARTEVHRRALVDVEEILASGVELDAAEQACARLVRERVAANVAMYDAKEHLRDLNHLGSPTQDVRSVFDLVPTATDDDWRVVAEMLDQVPDALASVRSSLELGRSLGLTAASRQVDAVVDAVARWTGAGGTTPWFADFVAPAPESRTDRLRSCAAKATEALFDHLCYLTDTYRPSTTGQPDAVGEERYRRFARLWNGADLDLAEAYAWGWQEHLRIAAEMRREADRILPGAPLPQVLRHLDEQGEAVEGVEAIRDWLQHLMEDAIASLDGTHFDLDPKIKVVEAMIAPPGVGAAPYYTPPTVDFVRPGRTWLPTLDRTRFPVWDLVSTWYHEGVPGHHLQLAQWALLADELSLFQTTLGWISANNEGWALYAERLMDELGYFADPGRRLGFLSGQQLRAVRVVVDIGMHLQLPIPGGDFHPGERWTPELVLEYLVANVTNDVESMRSEVIRYLGVPAQAIGYKLGERAWLAGRDAARKAKGDEWDAKAWHMAALSTGSLGLDDLTDVLAAL